MHRGKAPRQTRYAPQRDWRHIPSVSRSSGLESDGDALTNPDVQEDYFRVVSSKLEAYRLQSQASTTRKEMEENLLIMFRKLREGLQSSKRRDSFAYGVYETSAYLAVIASNGRHQALPILSHLIFELERLKPSGTHLEAVSPSPETPTLSDAVLIYLLETLSLNHPSQSGFLVAFQEARVNQRMSPSAEFFLHHLATALRRIDTVLLRHLLHPDSSAVKPVFDAPGRPQNPNSLMADAFGVLLGRIRSQARVSAWLCVRTAYRELSVSASGEWLVRSLLLGGSTCTTGADATNADGWLQDRARSGEAQEMLRNGETIPGRWSLRRPPN